jgi:DNA-binding transcriptional LysR family regulator
MLPMPRFVNLSKHEADISVSIERPLSGNYVVTKLSDYVLKLYASRDYLASHAPIHTMADLAQHNFIGYIDDLVFSEELRYRIRWRPIPSGPSAAPAWWHSTRRPAPAGRWRSCPASWRSSPEQLVPVLEEQIAITRTFWLVAASEQRHVARVSALWSYLRDCVEANRDFLMGRSRRCAGWSRSCPEPARHNMSFQPGRPVPPRAGGLIPRR